MSAGADPEFMETCSNLHRGFVLLCLQLSCLKIAHEKEIILIHRGIRANPLTPSRSATEAVLTSTNNQCFKKIEHVTFHL